MRKLASIRVISKLLPIQGADRIELAQIDGWQCIVKKGEFQKGDYCVYFEIDSFLPLEEKYMFLGKTKTFAGKEGYRIKTMKMRGAISQGLALPLTMFPELTYLKLSKSFEIGLNVTEQLGVIKYDTALTTMTGNSGQKPKGNFPSFIPKTNQERIQNLTSYWEVHKNEEFEETLKLDGSSMTCYKVKKDLNLWDKLCQLLGIQIDSTHFGVCSRNLELQRTDSNFWKAAAKYNIEAELPIGYAIQGELIAPNIQSNHEKVQEVEYYIFSVFDIAKQKYLNPAEKKDFLSSFSTLKAVPVVEEFVKIFQEEPTLDNLLTRVEGQSMNPGTTSEGRVYVSTSNPQVHFKCISNTYLLKEK